MKGRAMKDGSPLGKSCPHCPHAVPKFTLPTVSPAGCPRRFRASSCAKQPWQAERYLPRCHGFIKRLCLCGNCHPDGEREKKKKTPFCSSAWQGALTKRFPQPCAGPGSRTEEAGVGEQLEGVSSKDFVQG